MRRFFTLCLLAVCALPVFAREIAVTVLATTDLHGNIYPYDYLTGKPAERGLAKIATLIAAERKTNPSALLIDCGDTIQGAPMEGVYQYFVRTGKMPGNVSEAALSSDPMMLAMNYLHYDAMVVGNHEFNFGLKNLEKARGEARFPWLSANIKGAFDGGKPFASYYVKQVNGVKVAIVGVTTPAVPSWEKPENIKTYRFLPAVEALRATLAELRADVKPDVIIVAAHAGLDRDLRTGAVREAEPHGENMVYEMATQMPGVDAIVFGHTHAQLEEGHIGDVLLTQPKNWGISLARLQFTLEPKPTGGYRVVRKGAKLLPVGPAVAPDPEVLRLTEPYHLAAERYLNTAVGQNTTALDARFSRIQDTALIDAIQQVQLYYAKADVSFASSFNLRAAVPPGPVTIRQIASLYLYDNELYAIEGTGQTVKDALENAARYYLTCPEAACGSGPLLNNSVIGYNYDMAAGVTYQIDLSKPEGQRIVNLQYDGKPLSPTRKLRIALNNYRAGGSAGYTMFKDAKVLWRSYEDIRELIIGYYSDHKLPSTPDQNWTIVPEGARRVLAAETANYR